MWQATIREYYEPQSVVLGLELLRDWSQSRVIRLHVSISGRNRTLYAKQAHVGMERELAIYQLAGQVAAFPAPKGMLVSVEGTKWLLLEEACGTRLANSMPEDYIRAVTYLAEFHETAQHQGWAKKAGLTVCLPGRLSLIIEGIFPAINNSIQDGTFSGVDQVLLSSVHHAVKQHKQYIIDQLIGFPRSLVHGDCHSGNIFLHSEGIHLVDWGSATLAPGLLDIVGLVDVALRMNENIGDAYLILKTYWFGLSETTRTAYESLDKAWQLLSMIRALLELEWFVTTGEDYGNRVNRELNIIERYL